MEEQLILRTSGVQLMEGDFVRTFVGYFYKKTCNKLSINFHGSKGYLDSIEFASEGTQKYGENVINVYDITLKKNRISKKPINIFYSSENGIRISFGKLLPDDPKFASR